MSFAVTVLLIKTAQALNNCSPKPAHLQKQIAKGQHGSIPPSLLPDVQHSSGLQKEAHGPGNMPLLEPAPTVSNTQDVALENPTNASNLPPEQVTPCANLRLEPFCSQK